MRKSTRTLAGAAVVLVVSGAAALLLGSGALTISAGAVAGLMALAVGWLARAGALTQERQRRIESGEPDLFLALNQSRSEAAVVGGLVPLWSAWRRWVARRLFGHSRMVGDSVQVKPLAAIRATLDAEGCLNGLPFMDEMVPFCGQSLRVYRVVDKIYDYGRSRLMRRLDDCVLLVGLRCDGGAHAGCEAACYVIWKAAWLDAPAAGTGSIKGSPGSPAPGAASDRLSCQYTQLTQSSRAAAGSVDVHGVWGPLAVGNVTASAFFLALMTRAFNAFQSWRGGAAYPAKPVPSDDKTIRGEPLARGDWVRVKTPVEIARAMDKNSKNRGLWFDRDMLKHCGQTYQVRGRVEKIIDVGSGKIIPMKTPCIVLEDVHYSGEFQGFGEQHDFLYWREAWLQPVVPTQASGQ